MKNNKLNEEDCGPKLKLCEDGFIVKYTGPNESKIKQLNIFNNYLKGANIIRAVLPIPSLNPEIINKQIITSYFEIVILRARIFMQMHILFAHMHSIGDCVNSVIRSKLMVLNWFHNAYFGIFWNFTHILHILPFYAYFAYFVAYFSKFQNFLPIFSENSKILYKKFIFLKKIL